MTHQYLNDPTLHTIYVLASGSDGKFTSGAAPNIGGSLNGDFNAGSGSLTDRPVDGGAEPNWVIQVGIEGQTATNFNGNNGYDHASAVVMDNGNILVVGTTGDGKFGLARYLDDPGQSDDGELDTSFGSGGLVTTAFTAGSASATAVAVDEYNGLILVAGTVVDGSGHNELALARYNDSDGSLDSELRHRWDRDCRPGKRVDQYRGRAHQGRREHLGGRQQRALCPAAPTTAMARSRYKLGRQRCGDDGFRRHGRNAHSHCPGHQ